MSVKENVEFIKKEIDTEETFLENFFKIEKFYKKNKLAIISTISLVVVAFVGNSVYSYIQEQNKLAANTLLDKVLQNPNDTASIEALKQKDMKLYNIALYLKNSSANIDVEYLKELSLYNQAIKEKDESKLSTISANQNFILKDFALLNKAILQVEKKEYQSAKETLKLISANSDVSKLAKMLEHFLITKVN